jgi:hypothetical protein
MAEDCAMRRLWDERRVWGHGQREYIRECACRPESPVVRSIWIGLARSEATLDCNPPDERRAWAELLRELEALA